MSSQNRTLNPDNSCSSGYVLVTGGAGYIGSHCVLELLKEGYHVVVVDNLSNSSEESLKRVEKLTGKNIYFRRVDILNKEDLRRVFQEFQIHSVIHFAGSKVPEESTRLPLLYYKNNVGGTITLLECIKEFKVRNLIFSSTAAVYGEPKELPISEMHSLNPISPYGRSKQMIEEMIKDYCSSDPSFNAAILRYFNPIGAHESGLIGEDPRGVPNSLVPYITRLIVGKLPLLKVYGNNFPTRDGTGIRDYIHVVDLALGHIAALRKLSNEQVGCVVYNLGTGKGFTVLEVMHALQQVSGETIPYQVTSRRAADVSEVVAATSKAEKELKWKALRGLVEMAKDAWAWQLSNPNGFNDSVNGSIPYIAVAGGANDEEQYIKGASQDVHFESMTSFHNISTSSPYYPGMNSPAVSQLNLPAEPKKLDVISRLRILDEAS